MKPGNRIVTREFTLMDVRTAIINYFGLPEDAVLTNTSADGAVKASFSGPIREYSRSENELKAALPKEGQVVSGADFSQLEARVVAHLAETRGDIEATMRAMAADFANAITMGCQKALDAQVQLFRGAVKKAEEGKAVSKHAIFGLGQRVEVAPHNPYEGSRGCIVAAPDVPSGYCLPSNQYRVLLDSGLYLWLHPTSLIAADEPATIYVNLDMARFDYCAGLSQVKVTTPMGCYCCGKNLIYRMCDRLYPREGYNSVRIMNVEKLRDDNEARIIAICKDCDFDGSYKEVQSPVFYKQGFKIGQRVRMNKSFAHITRFILFFNGEAGVEVRTEGKKTLYVVPFEKVTRDLEA